MARLFIHLFGPFQIDLEGEPVAGFDSDKVRALLAYLVTEPDWPHRREKLAALLWPNWPERSARTNLRHALANLRRVIGDHQATPPFLCVSWQTIQFNSASHAWVDVTAFTRQLEAKRSSQQNIRQLEEAIELYRGDFLEGFTVNDSVAFEEWLLFKREQYQRQALATLYCLVAHYEKGSDYELALPYAWRQVELEPWREEAQRQLMRLLALSGQRGAALAQYETCRRVLAEELRVEPARETIRLYKRLRDGEVIDLGQAGERLLAHQAGPRAVTLPPQPVETALDVSDAPASPSPTQRRLSRWRIAGGAPTLVGGGFLFLVIVGAILFFIARGGFVVGIVPEVFTPPPTSITMQSAGGKIVYVCADMTPSQICIRDIRTGQQIQVTGDLTIGNVGHFSSWSPDGQQIVFDAASDFNLGGQPIHKLYVINTDGSGLRQITGGGTNDIMPVWSPDGQWITFHRNSALWIVHPDGSAAQLLFSQEEFCVGGMAWSPDSQQVAFVKNRCPRLAPLPAEVRVINRDGTALRLVHSFGRSLVSGNLAWSPDGRQLICLCEYDGQEEVLLLNADGRGEPQRIIKIPWSWFPNFWPQWREEG